MATAPILDADEVEVEVQLPPTPGRAPATTSIPVVLSDEDKAVLDAVKTALEDTSPVSVTSPGYAASASFTPAASSHVAGDVVGGAQAFALAAISGSDVMITSVSLMIEGATAEATAWRLHLYDVTPPSALADDAAWDIASGDRASYLGYIDLGTAIDVGSTQYVETNGVNKQVKLNGTSLFGYLVNLTTLTPAAVAHTVKLNAVGL